jgi:hypothetical protein
MGAFIGSFVSATNKIHDVRIYSIADIAFGSLASRAAGIEATVAIAVVNRMLRRVPALQVGTVVYAIMYGVLNYFCAAKFGKLAVTAVAAGTGATAGGVVKLYNRR